MTDDRLVVLTLKKCTILIGKASFDIKNVVFLRYLDGNVNTSLEVVYGNVKELTVIGNFCTENTRYFFTYLSNRDFDLDNVNLILVFLNAGILQK